MLSVERYRENGQTLRPNRILNLRQCVQYAHSGSAHLLGKTREMLLLQCVSNVRKHIADCDSHLPNLEAVKSKFRHKPTSTLFEW